jgi:hypothetical protein
MIMKFKLLSGKMHLKIVPFFFLCIYTLNSQVNFAQTRNDRFIEAGIRTDPTVSIEFKDTLTLPSFTEFRMPVIMPVGHEISAISLGFYFPQEFLEIDSMEMTGVPHGYSFSVIDSLFRMAWSNVNPVNVADGGTLITLKMKTLDLSGLTGTIRLNIYELSEFADQSANIIDSVVLEIPEIEYFMPEPDDSIDGNYVRVYPNPFDDYASVNFALKEDSRVKISIFNPAGMEMMRQEADYLKGTHDIKLYAIDFAKGIYLMKFEIENSEGTSSKLFKLLVTR